MKKWSSAFWGKHGDRVFFLAIVFILGCLFIGLGQWILEGAVGEQLTGAGIAQLIGVATLAMNKARSPEDKPVTVE